MIRFVPHAFSIGAPDVFPEKKLEFYDRRGHPNDQKGLVSNGWDPASHSLQQGRGTGVISLD
jgi:hypothetical protein